MMLAVISGSLTPQDTKSGPVFGFHLYYFQLLERVAEKEHSPIYLFTKWPQQPWVDQAEAKSLELHPGPPDGCKGPYT